MNRIIIFRSITVRLILAFLLLAFAGLHPASARPCERDHLVEAKPFVQQLANQANEIKSRYTNPLPVMMVHILDNLAIDRLARETLGRHWSNTTDSQRIEYKVLFTKISLHRMAKQALSLADVSVVVHETRALDADRVFVNSKIIVGPTNTFRLDWLIVYRNCKPYVADMIYEGISLVTTKRDEVDAVVSRFGVDVLLEKLASIAKMQSSEVRTAEFAQVNFDTLILKAKENP